MTLAGLPTGGSTVVLAISMTRGERTMLSDRQTLDPAAAPGLIEGAGWLHCSGYPLLDDRTGDELASDAAAPARLPCGLSVAGGSVPPDPARSSRLRAHGWRRRGPDLVLLSEDEAATMLGRPSPRALAAAIDLQELAAGGDRHGRRRRFGRCRGELRVEVAAQDLPGPMLDATGSGDAYVAGLLVELADGDRWPPAEADLRRAMAAGSRLGALAARAVGAQARIDGERPPA